MAKVTRDWAEQILDRIIDADLKISPKHRRGRTHQELVSILKHEGRGYPDEFLYSIVQNYRFVPQNQRETTNY